MTLPKPGLPAPKPRRDIFDTPLGRNSNEPIIRTKKRKIIVEEVHVPARALPADRVTASIIDTVVVLTPLIVSLLIAASAAPDAALSSIGSALLAGVLGTAGLLVGQVLLEGVLGQSLGKMLLGIVTVDASSAKTIGVRRSLIRLFVKLVLDILPLGMGILPLLRKENRQTRADSAADSTVLYVKRYGTRKSTEKRRNT